MQQTPIHQHPAWYGAVMGTGVIALALVGLGEAFGFSGGWLTWAAAAFVLLASALAVVLAPRYLRRLVPAGRQQLHRELREPAAGALLGTAPGGLLVLAVAWPRVLGEPWGDAAYVFGGALLVLGAVLALAVGVAWAVAIADNDQPRLTHVNGGWFIPPVVNVLVALAIAPYLQRVPDSWVPNLFALGLLFWGAGFLLFLVVLPLLVARLALEPLAPAMLAPSHFIPLAPAGIAGVALVRLTQSGAEAGAIAPDVVPTSAVLAAALAGFGAWYTMLALLLLQRYRRAGRIPFHPGWWGFTFPIGAMAVSLALQSTVWEASALAWLSVAYAAALVWAWGAVAVRSLAAVRR